jgi:hypothetical protein
MSIDKKSNYYDAGGIESIETIKAKLTPDQFVGYLLGNLLKYSQRANFKGSFDRDIEKVAIYAEMLKSFSMMQEQAMLFKGKETVCISDDFIDAYKELCLFTTARDVESFYFLFVWREAESKE